MAGKALMSVSNVTASEHPLASLAGLRAFQRGGNAFDAAAATSLALAVTQPHLNGLGGDFFGLFYSSEDRRVYCLNSSGWSPSSVTVEDMRAAGHIAAPLYGHRSAVIPGYVRGVCAMHERFGKLELSDDMRDALELADAGFPAGPGLVRSLTGAGDSLSKEARKVYFQPNGEVIPVGTLLKQKELARCLREIGRDGPRAFYEGRAAREIRAEMSRGGVSVDDEDLSAFEPEWCEPLSMDYHGTRVYEVPPNSMGPTTLLILKLLQDAGMGGGVKPNSAQRIKMGVEAAKVAYKARDLALGDPRFMDGGFDMDHFLRIGASLRGGDSKVAEGDTTYFAVADREGNLLSCIQSLFHGLGSRVYVPGCGFFLNNRGSAFRLRGHGPNLLQPRKRPLHTLSSLILEMGGRPTVAVGASGGDWRPQQHALFVTNIVDYSMDIERAIDYPRFLWDGGNTVRVEKGYAGLEKLKVRQVPLSYPGVTGVAQGVERMERCLKGTCDVRGEGLPAGY